jgi:hypothetical protein
LGANRLIGASNAPLDDYFLGIILGIFLEKFFKKNIKRFFYIIWLRFVKFFPKICHFPCFPNPFTSPFNALKKRLQKNLHYF